MADRAFNSPTSVLLLLSDGSSEESFAAVTGCGPVVLARGPVAADRAADHHPVAADQRGSAVHHVAGIEPKVVGLSLGRKHRDPSD